MYEKILIVSLFIIALVVLVQRYRNRDFYQHLFELEDTFEDEHDFSSLSKNVLQRLIKETNSVSGTIYWLDELQNELKLKALNGIAPEIISLITHFLRQPDKILTKLSSSRQILVLNNFVKNSNEDEYLTKLAETYRSLMLIPLSLGEEKLIGVIVLFKTHGDFTKRTIQTFNAFAPRLAVRLDNVRLYQLIRETAQENAKLYVNISKLYHQATIDLLTGLYNRGFLMQRIKAEIKKASRFKLPLSLIFLDIDHFKKVNDQHGHPVGDQLLTEFGDLLKKSVRDYDLACRFGGEEFVLLLPGANLINAFELAERLREKVENHPFSNALKITASFGVSALPELPNHQLDEKNMNIYIENLIAKADSALYQAKEAGRNRVVSTMSENS